MKTFNQFINESIRDKMTPKSDEDILKSLENLEGFQMCGSIYRHFKNNNKHFEYPKQLIMEKILGSVNNDITIKKITSIVGKLQEQSLRGYSVNFTDVLYKIYDNLDNEVRIKALHKFIKDYL